MRKYYFLALLLCTTRLVWAGPPDEMAAHLLDSISKLKNFQATFTNQIQEEVSGEELTGSIIVQGNQYRLVMGGQEVISDGTTVWNYLVDANEVQINDYNPEQNASMSWLLLTNWRQKYQFHNLSTQKVYHKCGNGPYDIHHTVTIIARDPENDVQQLIITIERDTKHIKCLEALDSNRQRHIFFITKFETELALDEAFFKFIPENHADIEVIDMRA